MFFRELRNRHCLSYIIGDERDLIAAVIDPTGDPAAFLTILEQARLRLIYAVETHTHTDHISSGPELARRTGCKLVRHQDYSEIRTLCTRAPAADGDAGIVAANCDWFPDLEVDEGDILQIGLIPAKVIHTPGHAADGICLALPELILTGDTLLFNQVGRTDFPTGNPEKLHQSLYERLLHYEDELPIFPAHAYTSDGASTLGREKNRNAFLHAPALADFLRLVRSSGPNRAEQGQSAGSSSL